MTLDRQLMKLISGIEKAFKNFLPTPLTIALILTVVTVVLALALTTSELTGLERLEEVFSFWSTGIWNNNLMVFAMQMMLMLVLGHALALTDPVDRFISYVTQFCTSTSRAAGVVTVLTILVALFNWGLGLVFGAILARKVGEHAARNNIPLNYALVGAAGYSGLMVWHGGISGSAPIKVAEEGHLEALMTGTSLTGQLPSSISFSETVFGAMNVTVIFVLLIALPLFMFWLGKRTKQKSDLSYLLASEAKGKNQSEDVSGAERLDLSRFFILFFGVLISGFTIYSAWKSYQTIGLRFISPNFINLLLLGLCLLIHKNIRSFLSAIDQAIGGASGILIQFPLYFGIMGIMKSSGLVTVFSDFFVSISNETTFPVFTFFSAGIVNVFVPSGGGQWGVQGPIILQAASELGVSTSKSIMALAYGDQLTNMLQPFWALPLLGITGLKARSILPYTVALMMVGALIFVSILLIF